MAIRLERGGAIAQIHAYHRASNQKYLSKHGLYFPNSDPNQPSRVETPLLASFERLLVSESIRNNARHHERECKTL
jgi:hypothetical protein